VAESSSVEASAERRMSRAYVVLLVAIVAHALGWALPVMDDYRGVHAFRVALSPLWPYQRGDTQFHIPAGPLVYLSVASALTNLVFAAVAIAALAGAVQTRVSQRVAAWGIAAATLLNLHWPISMGDSAGDLRSGYYVWIASFVLLLLAVHPALAKRAG
jgi:hypothetical protein